MHIAVRNREWPSQSSLTLLGQTKNANGNITASATVSAKLLQTVAIIHYTFNTEICTLWLSSPVTQGFGNICGGRMKLSNKDPFETLLFLALNSVCSVLSKAAMSGLTGNFTVDCRNAALGALALDITWAFADDNSRQKSIPIAMLDTGTARKCAERLCCVM